MNKKKKVIRITTVPLSLDKLLEGQLHMLSEHYEIVAVSSPSEELDKVGVREGVRVHALPMKRRISLIHDFVSLVRLIFFFLKEKPDMVHSLTPKAGLLAMFAGWLTRVPVRMHTFTGLVFPTAHGFLQKILITMDRLTCACATVINPEGQGVKQNLIDYRITSKPLHILANGNVNGIDLAYFQQTSAIQQKARTLRKQDEFIFVFVGRMVGDKGIHELVEAFSTLYQENPQIRLWLVGPFESELDPLDPVTEQTIHQHPGIVFWDFQEDIRPFLTAADVFVFPSYREGFPNVVIQAGAMDLPCIVTNINGCNEIIIPHKNGIIIPPHSTKDLYLAMQDLLNHPQERLRMAHQARELIASRYDRNLVWQALLQEYRSHLNHV